MKSFYQLLIVMLAGLLLTACSTTPQLKEPEKNDTHISWAAHKDYLTEQNNFQASGKIAIKQDGKRNSASLQWQQQNHHYRIFITGPLGSSAITITGSPKGVEMDISGEGRFYASSPEALMMQRLGWSLPINDLSYWAKGIPAPRSAYKHALDSQGRLIQLQQNQWLIEYKNYHSLADTDWPRKMELHYGEDIQVTLLIKQWVFPEKAL